MESEMLNIKPFVDQAYTRISEQIRKTPVEFSPGLSEELGCEVYFKCENYQLTGSFKIRGAMNKILGLNAKELGKGIVTASTGNHAAAVAEALEIVKGRGIIYMPENVTKTKIAKLEGNKLVELRFEGTDSVVAEQKAMEHAKESGSIWVSPYNDYEVIAGQGTIGVELIEQIAALDAIFVPVGGGGLISGIASYIKAVNPEIEIIGCQPKNSAVMYESIKAGGILELESLPTISDGTAGGVEQNSITFDFCKANVDRFCLVTEDEITEAVSYIIRNHNMIIEGAAGLALASLRKLKSEFKEKKVALILCGNKLAPEKLVEILSK